MDNCRLNLFVKNIVLGESNDVTFWQKNIYFIFGVRFLFFDENEKVLLNILQTTRWNIT